MSTSKDLKNRAMADKKSMPAYMWLLAGLAIGLFLAFLVYLQKQPADEISLKQAVIQELEKVKAKNESTQNNTQKTDTKTEPRFDFYTILPELEVLIPESEINSNAKENSPSEKNTVTASGKRRYIIQVGSFRSKNDAERLKANLALFGLSSGISSVRINQDSWYRVRLGPFNNISQLQNTLATLKSNNIHAMTMELKD